MSFNRYGIGIYWVLTVIFFIGLVFILALPMFFDLDKKEKTEQCISNMNNVKSAVEQYMHDRNEIFTGTTADLVRTNYLRSAFDECPEGQIGDKYSISVDPETREVTVRCQNVAEFVDHTL